MVLIKYFLPLCLLLSLLLLTPIEGRRRRHTQKSGVRGPKKGTVLRNPLTLGLDRTPVILVPGIAGSQLEARRTSPLPRAFNRTTNSNSSAPKCHRQKQKGWYRIWMDVWQLLPGEVECWADNLALYYDEALGDSFNAPGIEIRVPGWGDVSTMEFIDPSFTAWMLGNAGVYMAPFIEELERWGYKRGKDLRGAPYDFRYSPHSQAVYFRELQHLIEDTFYINRRKKVALISHSMGGLFATYFLNLQTQQWKSRFIAHFTTINTPWEGTAYMPMMMVSGSNFGISELDPLSMRQQQRSYETAPFVLPTPDTWGKNRLLVQSPGKNYTAHDYFQLFEDIGYTQGKSLYRKAMWDRDMLRHPGVDMHCIYSTGIKTIETAKYGPSFDEMPYGYTMGDGDGTVNRRSLIGCSKFYDSDYPFHMRYYRKLNHNDILASRKFFKQMRNLLVHL